MESQDKVPKKDLKRKAEDTAGHIKVSCKLWKELHLNETKTLRLANTGKGLI